MTASEMASAIVRIVNNQGGALFSQLIEQLGPASEGCGHIFMIDYPNVVLWTNVSELFVEAFNEALPQLDMRRANPAMYAMFSDETGFPALPVVSAVDWRDKNLNYENKRWLPVVFFVGETAQQNPPPLNRKAPTSDLLADDEVLHPAAA